jgi:hypothetical protein
MPYYIDQLKQKFNELEWNRVYDFLEFLISIENFEPYKNDLVLSLNQVIDNIIVPLISEIEVEEIEKAVQSKYSQTSNHIKKALELYSKRPIADYKNSIKESISAIEALARIILNKPSATLSALAEKLNIHPAFKEGIKKLYSWTSDEGGIRHSENGKELNIGVNEARYMLVQCSALANYIISKYEK